VSDVAQLGITIDSTQTKAATVALDNLTVAAKGATMFNTMKRTHDFAAAVMSGDNERHIGELKRTFCDGFDDTISRRPASIT
jgi:hypothetical protein